jgi:Phosphorylase superfamily
VRIVAPLRLEAMAVGGTRIGMRARRPLPPGPLLLAGVAGAVVPGLSPGDIVVAERVLLSPTLPPGPPQPADPVDPADPPDPADPQDPADPLDPSGAVRPGEATVGRELVLTAAGDIARSLRIAGLTVHVGPVGGADRVVTGAARTAWADRGALAVDMESGVLARTGRLAAVVRAIVDTPTHPLVSLGTLPRGSRALHALRRAAPVLSAWAAGQGEADVRERQAAHVVDITITLPGEVENS